MTIEQQILTSIREIYKNDKDKEKNEQLYAMVLKAVFRYKTDQSPAQYASKAALAEAEKQGINLKEMTWQNQTKVDKDRSVFHYEHCNPISELRNRVLTTDEDIAKILEDDIVCWILKTEDGDLNNNKFKSKREGGWKKCYKECGIEPIELN